MKSIIVFAMTATFWTCAFSAKWEPVSSKYIDENTFNLVEIDLSSLSSRDGVIQAWFRQTVSPGEDVPGSYPSKSYMSALWMYHFNCKHRELAPSKVIYYSGKFSTGDTVGNETVSWASVKSSMSAAAPETSGAHMLDRACSFWKLRK